MPNTKQQKTMPMSSHKTIAIPRSSLARTVSAVKRRASFWEETFFFFLFLYWEEGIGRVPTKPASFEMASRKTDSGRIEIMGSTTKGLGGCSRSCLVCWLKGEGALVGVSLWNLATSSSITLANTRCGMPSLVNWKFGQKLLHERSRGMTIPLAFRLEAEIWNRRVKMHNDNQWY